MVYVDTSVIVKLYIREPWSREAADWIRDNNEAIPKTIFHELEFENAVRLKQFRHELKEREAEKIFERFRRHESSGIYYSPHINWAEAFTEARGLSKKHTKNIGSRTLDIIHVALAFSIGASRFFTFDEKQSLVADAAGLKIISTR